MTAARRLAAILAADVVGYSRLMGEDEAGTAQAVPRAAPIVFKVNDRFPQQRSHSTQCAMSA